MIPAKLLRPADLAKTQTFYIHKINKIIMVYKHKYSIFATF